MNGYLHTQLTLSLPLRCRYHCCPSTHTPDKTDKTDNTATMAASAVALLSLASIALGQGSVPVPAEECPLLGPMFVSDFDLKGTEAFNDAIEEFPHVIQNLFDLGVVNATTSSFYIDVYSAVTHESLFSYSHQATKPSINDTFPPDGIDDQTVFRTGSVSKLYTVYAILARAGGMGIMDEPVTDYLPELKGNPRNDPLRRIVWEDVTVGSLASHQAGAGQFPIKAFECLDLESPGCSNEEYLASVKNTRIPSQALHHSSLYADGGFGVLGQVLMRMTNMSYHESLRTTLSVPLNLNSSLPVAPVGDDLNAVVGGASSWGFDVIPSAP